MQWPFSKRELPPLSSLPSVRLPGPTPFPTGRFPIAYEILEEAIKGPVGGGSEEPQGEVGPSGAFGCPKLIFRETEVKSWVPKESSDYSDALRDQVGDSQFTESNGLEVGL